MYSRYDAFKRAARESKSRGVYLAIIRVPAYDASYDVVRVTNDSCFGLSDSDYSLCVSVYSPQGFQIYAT